MPVEVRYVADGQQREDWTVLSQLPGETERQLLDRKEASHIANGWTIQARAPNAMTAAKDYPHNEPPFPKRKERIFRVRG